MSEVIKYRGYKITISQDEDAENPYTEMDQTTDLVTWHRNYEWSSDAAWIGGKVPNTRGNWGNRNKLYASPQEVLDAVKSGDLVYATPLFAYEHGGITVNLGSMDYRWPDQQWDCGLLGMVFITREKAKAEWPNYGGRVLQHVCQKRAEQEVETFDQYLTGDVWHYQITRKGKQLDSCGWIYGYDYCESEAKAVVDAYVVRKAERKAVKAHEKVLNE